MSILFADLVGSTSLAEDRDPEDVRALLDAYFNECRRVVARYGGTIEKFIGDAVMALWGAPVAREDDAERAVRAALGIVDAVEGLGVRMRMPSLRARGGVVTGEAAVTINVENQGLVAGDTVNTAARVQSVADPGAVLVDDRTRSAAAASISFADVGTFTLKGKTAPQRLWRAERVVAGAGGVLRSSTLETPFVGRDGELRLVKELFHATADERRARLVSIVGVAGIGKSRLAWEFEKYLDGLVENVRWHRGRCLPYGEGVTYWALAEAVRGRCGITEEDSRDAALDKLTAKLQELLPSTDERRFAEPRLAHLIGLGDGVDSDREDLFGAWRMFFESIALTAPTVLVIEDLQWADDGLLDFIEYLLEWGRSLPLYVVTLARPELVERRPTWGSAQRSFTSLHLEQLPLPMIEQMLQSVVPGLPDDARSRLAARSEGVPLYAVETLRMLIDHGILKQDGDGFIVIGDIDAIELPDTLQALVQARLDALTADERDLVQHAAVLGQTFLPSALAAMSARALDDVSRVLAVLVRKEIVALQTDPLAADRGQYSFVQAVVRKVAYETLGRRERRARHLAAASYLERTTGTAVDDVPEVVAEHYLQAFYADPDDDEGKQLRGRARVALVDAAQRASSLGSMTLAMRLFERAATLAESEADSAELRYLAGDAALGAGDVERGDRMLREALRDLLALNLPALALRAVLALLTRTPSAAYDELLEVRERVESSADPGELARVDVALARVATFRGRRDEALARVESALLVAEDCRLEDVIIDGLIAKSTVLSARGRRVEAIALLEKAVQLSRRGGVGVNLFRACNNLTNELALADDFDGALAAARLWQPVARRRGHRVHLLQSLGDVTMPLFHLARWDEAREVQAEMEALEMGGGHWPWIWIYCWRMAAASGDPLSIADPADFPVPVDDQQAYAASLAHQAIYLRGHGRDREAARLGPAVLEASGWEWIFEIREALAETAEASIDTGTEDWLREALRSDRRLSRPFASSYVWGVAERSRARLAAADGDVEAARRHAADAVSTFRTCGMRYELAGALVDQAVVEFAASGTRGTAAEAEAREILTEVGAGRAVERLDGVLAGG